MAKVYQVSGSEHTIECDLRSANSLFIETDSGATIRVEIQHDGILICPINGVEMTIGAAPGGGAHGIRFFKN
jgi:hypothetical protein